MLVSDWSSYCQARVLAQAWRFPGQLTERDLKKKISLVNCKFGLSCILELQVLSHPSWARSLVLLQAYKWWVLG